MAAGGLVLATQRARARDARRVQATFDWAAAGAGRPLRDAIKVYDGGALAAFEETFPFGEARAGARARERFVSMFPAFARLRPRRRGRRRLVQRHQLQVRARRVGGRRRRRARRADDDAPRRSTGRSSVSRATARRSRSGPPTSSSRRQAGGERAPARPRRRGLHVVAARPPARALARDALAAAAPAAGGAPSVTAARAVARGRARARPATRRGAAAGNDASPDFVTSHLGYTTDNGAYYYTARAEPHVRADIALVLDASTRAACPRASCSSTRVVRPMTAGCYRGRRCARSSPTASTAARRRGAVVRTTEVSPREHHRGRARRRGVGAVRRARGRRCRSTSASSTSRPRRLVGHDVYEQDFLACSTRASPRAPAGAARRRMRAPRGARCRGAGRGRARVLCMGQAAHALKGALLRSVTHVRCTRDHTPGGRARAYVALNALLLWSVGLVPYKDGFWSTSVEPAPPCPTATAAAAARRARYPARRAGVEPDPELGPRSARRSRAGHAVRRGRPPQRGAHRAGVRRRRRAAQARPATPRPRSRSAERARRARRGRRRRRGRECERERERRARAAS